jgi:hypothetical protein
VEKAAKTSGLLKTRKKQQDSKLSTFQEFFLHGLCVTQGENVVVYRRDESATSGVNGLKKSRYWTFTPRAYVQTVPQGVALAAHESMSTWNRCDDSLTFHAQYAGTGRTHRPDNVTGLDKNFGLIVLLHRSKLSELLQHLVLFYLPDGVLLIWQLLLNSINYKINKIKFSNSNVTPLEVYIMVLKIYLGLDGPPHLR